MRATIPKCKYGQNQHSGTDPFTAGLRAAAMPPCRDARAGQHSFLRRTITEDGFAQISGVGPKMASDFAALFVAAI